MANELTAGDAVGIVKWLKDYSTKVIVDAFPSTPYSQKGMECTPDRETGFGKFRIVMNSDACRPCRHDSSPGTLNSELGSEISHGEIFRK